MMCGVGIRAPNRPLHDLNLHSCEPWLRVFRVVLGVALHTSFFFFLSCPSPRKEILAQDVNVALLVDRMIHYQQFRCDHDDVIKWKHFSRNWPFVRGIHRGLNKRLSKQSWGWWFETLSRPLLRHCNAEAWKACRTICLLDATASQQRVWAQMDFALPLPV